MFDSTSENEVFMAENLKNSTSQISEEKIEEIVKSVVKNHNENGGSTVNKKAENLIGEKLFAVSVFQLRTFVLQEREISQELVYRFVKQNLDLLVYDFCVIGTWFDKLGNASILDVSIMLSSKNLAIELGEKFNQIAIYDLHAKKEIRLNSKISSENEDDISDKEILDFVIEKQLEEEK